MTEANHPMEDQARALVDDLRFCEFLDVCHALRRGWPHSRYSARRWLEEQCGIESLGHLAIDPEAAAAFAEISRRFAAWDRNGELEV
ncbi:hypothetical protein M8009_00640 [Halomonas sp. ATCH28]|uniref:Uncharacterized protein n=1 Tax=Halomonas gemina TaxID=2945105 RepID=A0ABT0SXD1_9GAMM|nr:hypothetical protein [Halomonas gemina]MCL7938810.1 hypothetical protein [Halomonas gemina]